MQHFAVGFDGFNSIDVCNLRPLIFEAKCVVKLVQKVCRYVYAVALILCHKREARR